MGKTCSHLPNFVLFSFSLLLPPTAFAAGATDTLHKGSNITDGQPLISAGGTFTLGFFSPGASSNRYLGIWFTVSREAVCWVANGVRPLNESAGGVLVISDTGSLLLLDDSSQIAWSSGTTSPAVEAQLLDNGNLVARDRGSSNVLRQTFDYPSNTMLSGMKVGKNLWTGTEWYLTSWRSADDLSPGDYRRVLDTSGLPALFLWQGGVKRYRAGPWNGRWFSGIAEASTYVNLVAWYMTISPAEIAYMYTTKPGAPLTRVVVTDTDVVKRLVWDASTRTWETFFQGPRDVCDDYGMCGAFGVCDAGAASTSFCTCLKGFSPASPSEWSMKKTSGGCRRNVALGCGGGRAATSDGFVAVRGVKLPDTHNASVDLSITVAECRARCLANCSCVAYAALPTSGEAVMAVVASKWRSTISSVDLRYVDRGQYLFLRVAKSELGNTRTRRSRRIRLAVVLAICVFIVAAISLLLVCIFWKHRRCIIWWHRAGVVHQHGVIAPMEPSKPLGATAVAFVDLATIEKATRNFSKNKVIGQGAFGVVYEGHLPNGHPLLEGSPGKKIAVKRLKISSLPRRVHSDFDREVTVTSKLHHENLVRLLAYCDEGNERILVHEYMQNRSLNLHIFGDRGHLNLRSKCRGAQ